MTLLTRKIFFLRSHMWVPRTTLNLEGGSDRERRVDWGAIGPERQPLDWLSPRQSQDSWWPLAMVR